MQRVVLLSSYAFVAEKREVIIRMRCAGPEDWGGGGGGFLCMSFLNLHSHLVFVL